MMDSCTEAAQAGAAVTAEAAGPAGRAMMCADPTRCAGPHPC